MCEEITLLKSFPHLPGENEILWWRQNGRDSVSNHQPHNCLLNRLFGCRSKKTSKLRVTGLCVRNSPGTGEFPAQMASNAENVSIWWHHHITRSSYLIVYEMVIRLRYNDHKILLTLVSLIIKHLANYGIEKYCKCFFFSFVVGDIVQNEHSTINFLSNFTCSFIWCALLFMTRYYPHIDIMEFLIYERALY